MNISTWDVMQIVLFMLRALAIVAAFAFAALVMLEKFDVRPVQGNPWAGGWMSLVIAALGCTVDRRLIFTRSVASVLTLLVTVLWLAVVFYGWRLREWLR